jgi:sodium-coupled monocarboxylate transporter 8/12
LKLTKEKTGKGKVGLMLYLPKDSLVYRAIWWNVLGIGGLLLICGYGGLVMFAYYHDCDPVKTQQVSKKDQLFPLFVMQVMGDIPGIPGKKNALKR